MGNEWLKKIKNLKPQGYTSGAEMALLLGQELHLHEAFL